MAALTLIEAAKLNNGTEIERAIIEIYAGSSTILTYLPFRSIPGNALAYNREQTLPSIGFRGVNESYPPSVGILNPLTETLVIAGGEIDIDRFILQTQGREQKSSQTSMKLRSLGLAWTKKFFKGDSLSDPREFDGLQVLVTSYGGSGLNWIAGEIGKQRRVTTPTWDQYLCHWPPLGLRLPTLVLLADPVIAWESMRRRDVLQQNARAMVGLRKDDPRVVDPVEAMASYFDRWTADPHAKIVRYEDLPERLPAIWQWLGLRGQPPEFRQRTTEAPSEYPAGLDALRERWAKL